jgi:hypothetical protein
MRERWVKIKKWNDKEIEKNYEVSNFGFVRRKILRGSKAGDWEIKKSTLPPDREVPVIKLQLRTRVKKTGTYLNSKGERKERKTAVKKWINVTVPRLVAEHFVDKPADMKLNKYGFAPATWIVEHIDGNKQNNSYSNLRWVQIKNSRSHLNKPYRPKDSEQIQNFLNKARQFHLENSGTPVVKLDPNSEEVVGIYRSIGEARRFNEKIRSTSQIRDVVIGRKHCKTAGGFKWESVESFAKKNGLKVSEFMNKFRDKAIWIHDPKANFI